MYYNDGGTSIFFRFDAEGKVSQLLTEFGDMVSIREMQNLAEYANGYIERFGSQGNIDFINNQRRELEKADSQKRIKEERLARKNRQKVEPSCDIYLIKDTIREVYKIGKAKMIVSRFKQLKTANAGIELVTFYRGYSKDEKILHSIYEAQGKRVSGEWFNLTAADLKYFSEYFNQDNLPF